MTIAEIDNRNTINVPGQVNDQVAGADVLREDTVDVFFRDSLLDELDAAYVLATIHKI